MTQSDRAWFYHVNNERQGPLTEAQTLALLHAGTISGDTPVWTEGMAGWQPLRTTPLSAHLAPPPLPAATSEATVFAPRPLPGDAASAAGPAQQLRPAAPRPAAPQPSPMALQPGAQAATIGGMPDAVRVCFSKYVTFSGRATRAEYWWFVLAYFLATIATLIVDMILPVPFLTLLLILGLLLPSISVLVRRLHDTDRTGWWYWIVLTGIGLIVMIIFLCQPSTPGPNRFGPKP